MNLECKVEKLNSTIFTENCSTGKCGGTILTKRHILTAKHCVSKTAKMKVVVGELDWCKYVGVNSSDGLTSESAIFHEKFDNVKDVSEVIAWEGEPRDVDLAILKVCPSFLFVFISTVHAQVETEVYPTQPDLSMYIAALYFFFACLVKYSTGAANHDIFKFA